MYGYITRNNEVKIPFQYSKAFSYYENDRLAYVNSMESGDISTKKANRENILGQITTANMWFAAMLADE